VTGGRRQPPTRCQPQARREAERLPKLNPRSRFPSSAPRASCSPHPRSVEPRPASLRSAWPSYSGRPPRGVRRGSQPPGWCSSRTDGAGDRGVHKHCPIKHRHLHLPCHISCLTSGPQVASQRQRRPGQNGPDRPQRRAACRNRTDDLLITRKARQTITGAGAGTLPWPWTARGLQGEGRFTASDPCPTFTELAEQVVPPRTHDLRHRHEWVADTRRVTAPTVPPADPSPLRTTTPPARGGGRRQRDAGAELVSRHPRGCY